MGDARAVMANPWSQQTVEARRSTLLATTALAGVVLAAAMASPQGALAQSCSTSGTDPVTVTCNAPGQAITTANNINGASPNPATNDSTQFFNTDLIGNVTANTTVNGFGLSLLTTKTNGGIAVTNNGLVSSQNGGFAALGLRGNGGAVTYNGTGSISSTNAGADALNLANIGNGAVSATINNNVSSANTSGVSANGVDGLVTVNITGGTIASGAGGQGIGVNSSGTGSVTVNMTGGQVGTSGAPVGGAGIIAIIGGAGSPGNITVTSTAVFSTGTGIGASINDAASTGNITVTTNGNITATGAGQNAVSAQNFGTGSVTYIGNGSISSMGDALSLSGNGAVSATINNNIASANGNGVGAFGVNGLVTVNVTGGAIAAGGSGITAQSNGTGSVVVNMTGGQIGTSGAPVGGEGIVASVNGSGSPGNVTVTSGTVFSAGRGIDAKINDAASTGNVMVTANGNVTATGAGSNGVFAQTQGTGTVLVTGAGNATGANGITALANNNALSTTGNVTVSGSGASTATDPNGEGIDAESKTGNVLVNRTGTASGANGIFAVITGGGTGNITVAGVGAATGTSTGIFTVAAAGTTTIATNANVTGGVLGISAGASTGAINVTTGGTVTGGSDAAVALGSHGNITVVNSGAIVSSNGLAGRAIHTSFGNTVVTNSGTIAGTVDLGGGTNAFNNLPGGVFLAGPTVNLGASNTLTNAGTFSPGGPSVMTTTLTGNYVQTASGTYAFTVSPAAASRTNVSGTANISGAAQALALPGTYTPGRTYTILTATGGVSGTFGTLAVSGSFGSSVQPTLTYDANDVFLFLKPTLTSSLPAGASANQKAVISAVNAGFAAGNAPSAFLPLFSLTPGSLGTAASQLSGEIATGAPTATFQAGAQFLALMVDPFVDAWSEAGATSRPLGFAPEAEELPPAASAFARVAKAPLLTKAPPRVASVEQRFTAWAAGYGGQGTLNGDAAAGSHDLTARSAGFAAGLDYRVAPNAVIGVAAASGSLSFGLSDGLGSGRGDGAQAGVYGKARFGDAYLAGAAAFARHDISTDRLVTGVPGFFDHLTADYSATSFGGRIEAGRRFATAPNFGVTPYAAWQAQSFTTPDYLEHGLAGFALSFRKHTTTDDRTELGAWLDSRWNVSESVILTLRDRAAWVHDFATDRSITALFQTLPTAAFTVLGAAPAPDAAFLSGRADLTFRNNVSLFARFDSELAQRAQTYSGAGGVKVTW